MSQNFFIGVATAISLLSAGIAFWSLSVSKTQFRISNQGYLDIDPGFSFYNKEIDKNAKLASIDDNFPINGLIFSLDLKNVGNLPLTYDVQKFDVYINDEKYSEPFKKDDYLLGVVYPKQQTTFYLKTIFLDKIQHKDTPFSDIKKLNIINEVIIRYSSEKALKDYKYIDRKFRWTVHDNVVKFTYITIDDKF